MSAGNTTIPPHFSVIIPIYNDWEALEGCLQALHEQREAPAFEVVVVDDGCQQEAPESIRGRSQDFTFTIVRQEHMGIGAARNCGIQNSQGLIVVFTDADCRPRSDCLANLARTITENNEKKCFQLRLVGDSSTLVGGAEDLRLKALQQHLLQPDGHIIYLNTSGFAIQRTAIEPGGNLFDRTVQRSEDSLLLANLIKRGELPFFVPTAVVQHWVRLSLIQCLRKDSRVAWFEAEAFKRINATGVQIRRTNWERFGMVQSMWRASTRDSTGRMAWFVAVVRQILQRAVSVMYNFTH